MIKVRITSTVGLFYMRLCPAYSEPEYAELLLPV